MTCSQSHSLTLWLFLLLPPPHSHCSSLLYFIYLFILEHWFIVSGYNPGTARWEICIGQGIWEGVWSSQALTRHLPEFPHVHQPRSSLNPVLLGFYGGFITKAWLNHWPLLTDSASSPFPLPGDWGVAPPPPPPPACPSGIPKVTLINKIKDLYHSHHLRNSKGFRILCQKGGQTKYILL